MRGTVAFAALLVGCGFSGPPGASDTGGSGADAGEPAGDSSVTGDAAGADCVIGGIDLCAEEPEPTLGGGVVDTDSDPRCIPLVQGGGPEACVLYTAAVSIAGGDTLTGIGARPLIIASRGDVVIDGVVDVSSQRGVQIGAGANDSACPAIADGQDDLGGGGGGAGGSGSEKGGDGGLGDDNNSAGADGTATGASAAPATSLPIVVRGGCPGSAGGHGGDPGQRPGGGGGDGGGAVAILSLTSIRINGGVRATGAGGGGGGVQAGGGGGGAGGYVALSAPSVVNDGMVIATGGGGGGGGVNFVGGGSATGGPGDDAGLDTEPAGGGAAVTPAGPGGPSATIGTQSEVGAGGGGGGPGFIAITGTPSGSGDYMPDP